LPENLLLTAEAGSPDTDLAYGVFATAEPAGAMFGSFEQTARQHA
jgi:hypothetical protein